MPSTDEIAAEAYALARKVAGCLGEGWSVEPFSPEHAWTTLNGPDGMALSFRVTWLNTERVEVIGTYPGRSGDSYGIRRHMIGVSRSRGAEVIAREITRRLLPVYRPDLQKAQERDRRDGERREARKQSAARIMELLPGSTVRDEEVSLEFAGAGWGSVRLDPDGQSGTVEVHYVPRDVLLRIVAAVGAPA